MDEDCVLYGFINGGDDPEPSGPDEEGDDPILSCIPPLMGTPPDGFCPIEEFDYEWDQVARQDPTNHDLPEDSMSDHLKDYLADTSRPCNYQPMERLLAPPVNTTLLANTILETANRTLAQPPFTLERYDPTPVSNVTLVPSVLTRPVADFLKCSQPIDAIPSGAPELLLDEATALVDDAVQCVPAAVSPLLDPVLDRVAQTIPDVTRLQPSLLDLQLPATVEGAIPFPEPTLPLLSVPFPTDSTSAPTEAPIEGIPMGEAPLPSRLEFPTSPEELFPVGLSPSWTLEAPNFLRTTLESASLGPAAQAVSTAEGALRPAGVTPASTADGIQAMVYTKEGTTVKQTPLLAGSSACIDTDANALTGTAGCDLRATFTLLQNLDPGAPGNLQPTGTPSIQFQKVGPNRSTPWTALAGFQAPGLPYVVALGYDATSTGSAPDSWTGILQGFTRGATDRLTVASFLQGAAVPLDLWAGAARFDPSTPTKDLEDDDSQAILFHTDSHPSTLLLDLLGHGAPNPEGNSLRIYTPSPLDAQVLLQDSKPTGDRFALLEAENLPSGFSQLAVDGSKAAGWNLAWNAPATTASLAAVMGTQDGGDVESVLLLEATDLAPFVSFQAEASTGAVSFTSSPATASFRILAPRGTDSCSTLEDQALPYIIVETAAESSCVAARLDDYDAVNLAPALNAITASGLSLDAEPPGFIGILHTAVEAAFVTEGAASQWTLAAQLLDHAGHEVLWRSREPTERLQVEISVPGSIARERFGITLEEVPSSVNASVQPALLAATVQASDFIGLIETRSSNHALIPDADAGEIVAMTSAPAPAEAAALLRLTGVQSLDVLATEAGNYSLDARFDSLEDRRIFLQRGAPSLDVELAGISGDVAEELGIRAETGTVAFTHDGTEAATGASLRGDLLGADLDLVLSPLPEDSRVSASILEQAVAVDHHGTEAFLHLALGYEGNHPTTTFEGDQVLVDDATLGGPRGILVDLADAASFAASSTPHDLRVQAEPHGERALRTWWTFGQVAKQADFSETPQDASLTLEDALLRWTTTAPLANDWTFSTADHLRPLFFRAETQDAPGSLAMAWVPLEQGATQWDLAHSGSEVTAFSAAYYDGVATDQELEEASTAWLLESAGVPGHVSFQAAPESGDLDLRSGTSTGSAAPTASLRFLAASGGQAFLVPDASLETDFVLLRSEGESALGVQLHDAVSASHAFAATPLNGTLGSDLGVDRSGQPRALVVDIRTSGAERFLHLEGDFAPAALRALLAPGATNQPGFTADFETSGAMGDVDALVALQDSALAFRIKGHVPEGLHASWSTGQSVHLLATEPTTVEAANSGRNGEAPWRGDTADFVAQRRPDAEANEGASFGARLTGLSRFDLALEALSGSLVTDGGATTKPAYIDYDDANGYASILASDLPSGGASTWNAVERAFTFDAGHAVGSWTAWLSARDSTLGRLYFDLQGVPAIESSFRQEGLGDLTFTSSAEVGRLRVTGDRGETGPLRGLAEDGAFLTEEAADSSFRVNLVGVQGLRSWAVHPDSGGRALHLDRGASAATGANRFQFVSPGEAALADVTGMSGGDVAIHWPQRAPSGEGAPMAFGGRGFGGHDGAFRYREESGDRGGVAFESGSAEWTLRFEPEGRLIFDPAGPSGGLASSGQWREGAFLLEAAGDLGGGLDASVPSGLAEGSVAADGGPIGSLRLLVAPAGGSGGGVLLDAPAADRDLFLVDAPGAGGGLLSLALPNFAGASWRIPQGESAVADDAWLLDVDLASASPTPTLLQVVHPSYQTRIEADRGLASEFRVEMQGDPQAWVGEVANVGKRTRMGHQDGAMGGLVNVTLDDPTAPGTLSFAPGSMEPFSYQTAGSLADLAFESNWQNGLLQLGMQEATSGLTMEVGEAGLDSGSVGMLGGAAERFRLLYVPATGTGINHAVTEGDQLIVEVGHKTPYASIQASDFAGASWSLPLVNDGAPVVAGFDRWAEPLGVTRIGVASTSHEATLEATNASADLELTVQPKPDPAAAAPLSVQLATSGGLTEKAAFTHVNVATGQSIQGQFEDLSGVGLVQIQAPTSSGEEPGGGEPPSSPEPMGAADAEPATPLLFAFFSEPACGDDEIIDEEGCPDLIVQTIDAGAQIELFVTDVPGELQYTTGFMGPVMCQEGDPSLSGPFSGLFAASSAGTGPIEFSIANPGNRGFSNTWLFEQDCGSFTEENHRWVYANLPTLKSVEWDLRGDCTDSMYATFPADFGDHGIPFSVYSPIGMIYWSASLASEATGIAGVRIGNLTTGIQFDATAPINDMRFFTDLVPNCMEYRTAVREIAISAQRLQPDYRFAAYKRFLDLTEFNLPEPVQMDYAEAVSSSEEFADSIHTWMLIDSGANSTPNQAAPYAADFAFEANAHHWVLDISDSGRRASALETLDGIGSEYISPYADAEGFHYSQNFFDLKQFDGFIRVQCNGRIDQRVVIEHETASEYSFTPYGKFCRNGSTSMARYSNMPQYFLWDTIVRDVDHNWVKWELSDTIDQIDIWSTDGPGKVGFLTLEDVVGSPSLNYVEIGFNEDFLGQVGEEVGGWAGFSDVGDWYCKASASDPFSFAFQGVVKHVGSHEQGPAEQALTAGNYAAYVLFGRSPHGWLLGKLGIRPPSLVPTPAETLTNECGRAQWDLSGARPGSNLERYASTDFHGDSYLNVVVEAPEQALYLLDVYGDLEEQVFDTLERKKSRSQPGHSRPAPPVLLAGCIAVSYEGETWETPYAEGPCPEPE